MVNNALNWFDSFIKKFKKSIGLYQPFDLYPWDRYSTYLGMIWFRIIYIELTFVGSNTFDNDNDNDLFIILTGIHSKYTVFHMLHNRYYPAPQGLSVSLNTIQW